MDDHMINIVDDEMSGISFNTTKLDGSQSWWVYVPVERIPEIVRALLTARARILGRME